MGHLSHPPPAVGRSTDTAGAGDASDARTRSGAAARRGDLVVHTITTREPAWSCAAGIRCRPLDARDALAMAAGSGPSVVVMDAAVLDRPDPDWVAQVTDALGPVVAVAGRPGDASSARASGVRATLPMSFLDAPDDLARSMLLECAARPAPAGADDLERTTRDALHEFRTPLTVILEFASLCLDGVGGELCDKHREYLGHLESAVLRLEEHLDDYRDTVLMRLGRLRPGPAGLPLRDAIEGALADLSDEVEFEDRVPRASLVLGLDAGRVSLALMRLLGVARKWSRGEGAVRLSIAATDAEERTCRVEVTYAGLAPSEDDIRTLRDGLVETEHGVDRTVARVFGLGVAMATVFVESEGGTVRLARTPDGGRFEVVLPLRSPGAIARAAA